MVAQESPVAAANGRNTLHLEHTGHGTPSVAYSGSPGSTNVMLPDGACRFGCGSPESW